MTNRFITFHILTALPMHNLNRDQNGMPKQTIDGDTTRARLSAQSLKRAARVAFRDKGDTIGSIRTRQAGEAIISAAQSYAERNDLTVDMKKVKTKAQAMVKDLTDKDDSGQKTTILFFSQAEIDTVAGSIVDSTISGSKEPSEFIRDSSSPSLDVAAFGRMFAQQHSLSTLAAVAVSHAVTTHEMTLTQDYFSAVEDGDQDHGGSGHLGLAYYTSGTYYRSFTIDTDQLARSWGNFGAPSAKVELAALIEALTVSLPRGRKSNTAPDVLPHTVLVETQATRVGYGFDVPVTSKSGGLADESAKRLAAERSLAVEFDGDLFGPAKVYSRTDADFQAEKVSNLDALVQFAVGAVYEAAESTEVTAEDDQA